MDVGDFSAFDVFQADIDDLTLSQVCEQMEKENAVFEGFDKLTMSQTMQAYGFSHHADPLDHMDFCSYEQTDFGSNMVNFDVNLPELSDADVLVEPEIKPTASVSATENTRFVAPLSETDVKKLIDSQENVNTKKNTTWALRVFESWRAHRNSYGESVKELHDMNTEEMNYYLGRFIAEARKQDGQPYPPRSLYLISCGLLRHLRDKKVYDKNFLCTKTLEFSEFRKILDARMKELLQMGFGTKVKQAQAVLPEDEKVLWEKGVFGNSTAEALQSTVFFYACKLFALRGHDEHHQLQCDQFAIGEDQGGKYVEFFGRSNKTYKGGLKDLEISNKNIRHYCQNVDRNVADFFKQYIEALGGRGAFYRRPLHGYPIRYGEQPIGINKLKNFMKIICERGGLKGNYTNHSGKRSCATQLYMAGVDEQEIMARTGHRSEKSVRKYKQSSTEIQQKVASVLDPPPTTCSLKRDRASDDGENCIGTCKSKKMKVEISDELPKTSYSSVLKELSQNRPIFSNCNISFNC